MRALLTLPFDPQYNRDSPDLGLGYLAAVLREDGHDVELMLRPSQMRSEGAFVEWLRRRRFDLYGIKVFSCQARATQRTIALIREADPHATIVLGGAHPSADPHHLFHLFPEADYGLSGEGEVGLRELTRVLTGGTNRKERLSGVPGLVWRDSDATRVNPPRYVEVLDTLPFPAWDLMPPVSFPHLPFNGYSRRHPIASMILTRGCPHRCTFCGAATVNGRRLRMRSADNIIDELRLLISRYGVREIQFYDSNCADRRGPLREVLRRIIAEGINITWCAPNGIRLDAVDEELVRLMAGSGCFQVNVGIESGSPRILKQIRKNLSLDMVRRSVALLRRGGIEVVGFFMFGFPGETREDIRQTLDLAMGLPLTGASFSIYCPLPGTDDYALTFREDRPHHDVLDSFDFVRYENHLSELSAQELRAIQRRAYLRFHLRPTVLRCFLRNLNSVEKVRFIMGHVRQKVLSS